MIRLCASYTVIRAVCRQWKKMKRSFNKFGKVKTSDQLVLISWEWTRIKRFKGSMDLIEVKVHIDHLDFYSIVLLCFLPVQSETAASLLSLTILCLKA